MKYGFLLMFAFVLIISYQNWFVYVELYYLQLFTIIAYHLNAHIKLSRYVICNYIWHMGSQNYELIFNHLWTLLVGRRLCAVESAARAYPEKIIRVIIDDNSTIEWAPKVLLDIYPNIAVWMFLYLKIVFYSANSSCTHLIF